MYILIKQTQVLCQDKRVTNFRVTILEKKTRLSPSSNVAIAFRAMKPLQNHFTLPTGALLGKLCLDWVGLSMPGFKVYALSPERQKITEKN